MRRYIRAELTRNLTRSYFLGMTLGLYILGIILNLVFSIGNLDNSYLFLFESIGQMYVMGIFLLIILVDMVTIEEFKNQTIKNVLASGLSRNKIIAGKITATAILGLVACLTIIGTYFISGRIILKLENTSLLGGLYRDLFFQLLGVIPLWIGGAALMTFSYILIRKSFLAGFFYYISIFIFPVIVDNIARLKNYRLLMAVNNNLSISNTMAKMIMSENLSQDFIHGLLLGLGYLLVFSGLSMLAFKKRDI